MYGLSAVGIKIFISNMFTSAQTRTRRRGFSSPRFQHKISYLASTLFHFVIYHNSKYTPTARRDTLFYMRVTVYGWI